MVWEEDTVSYLLRQKLSGIQYIDQVGTSGVGNARLMLDRNGEAVYLFLQLGRPRFLTRWRRGETHQGGDGEQIVCHVLDFPAFFSARCVHFIQF